MRHLTDTGKQIEQDMRRRYGRPGTDDLAEKHAAEERVEAELEQPPHPVAAIGVILLGIAALVAALTLTALFFISSIVVVPVAIAAAVGLGAWAFWSWERRRRAAAERGT